MSESVVLKEAMLAASECGARVFRNNVGLAMQPNGQVIKYGLCNGSSDLIGWVQLTITQDMVGLQVAQCLGIECKAPKKHPTKEQKNFIEQVNLAGGKACVARSGGDVQENLKKE